MRIIKLGDPLVQLKTVDSTNDYAVQLLRQEVVTEGTVILTVHQTHGRGQGGNRWVSEKGMNLLFSIILKPDFLPADKQFYLSMAVSNGIQNYLHELGLPAMVKWPNDILIRQKKVAGILIENTILAKNLNTSTIGIGLNVNQRFFPPEIPDPTSLRLETGNNFDLSETLVKLLSFLEVSLNVLYQENMQEIKSSYLNRLWNLNSLTIFTDKTGTFEGKIVDIAETGELMVMKANGEMSSYGFREVEYKEKSEE